MISSETEWQAIRYRENGIIQAVRNSEGQAVTFCTYMNWCLYHPEYGYYMNDRVKIGREGDFYTSSSISPLMGEMLANYYIKWAEESNRMQPAIIEWGAGTGKLAKAMLDKLARDWPDHYNSLQYKIIEKSAYHLRLLQQELAAHQERISFWDDEGRIQLSCNPVFLFSNELLDAFPVHRVRQENDMLMEGWIAWDEENHGLVEQWRVCADDRLVRYLEAHEIQLLDGQEAEINLQLQDWISKVGQSLPAGSCMVTIDYGDVATELFSAHRMKGTLMCYSRHQAADSVLKQPGSQDITAHVDFSACMSAGTASGLRTKQWMTQKQFLIEQGILDELQNHTSVDPFSDVARKNRQIRQLLLSEGMSELFKVLVQVK